MPLVVVTPYTCTCYVLHDVPATLCMRTCYTCNENPRSLTARGVLQRPRDHLRRIFVRLPVPSGAPAAMRAHCRGSPGFNRKFRRLGPELVRVLLAYRGVAATVHPPGEACSDDVRRLARERPPPCTADKHGRTKTGTAVRPLRPSTPVFRLWRFRAFRSGMQAAEYGPHRCVEKKSHR